MEPGNLPCQTEADVGDSNATEDEERRQTGQGEEPVEDVATSRGVQINECQTPEEELKDGDNERTALFVDIGEQLRSHP